MNAAATSPFRILVAAAVAALVLLSVAVSLVRRRRDRRLENPPAARPCAEGAAPGSRSEQVLALFGHLRAGSSVDGCRILEIYEDDRGCVPVLLAAPGGRRFRIDVLQREPGGPPPPAETGKLGLYLAGIRDGSPTPDECLRGARALAAALASVDAEPPPWLLTLTQRTALLRDAPGPS